MYCIANGDIKPVYTCQMQQKKHNQQSKITLPVISAWKLGKSQSFKMSST